MRVEILGSGFMGGAHARAYAKVKGIEVAAVTSRHLDKAQKLANEVGDARLPTTWRSSTTPRSTRSATLCRRISTPSTRSPR